MAHVVVKPVTGQALQVEVSAGAHKLICDQPVALGGADGGPNPKELAAAALGTCIAQTILLVAPKKKWNITDLTVQVTIDFPQGADPAIKEAIEVSGNLSQRELDGIKKTAERCPIYMLLFGNKTATATVTKK